MIDKSIKHINKSISKNFNDKDFAISFFYTPNSATILWRNAIGSSGNKSYIITKEGAQNSPPLGTQVGGNSSLNTSGSMGSFAESRFVPGSILLGCVSRLTRTRAACILRTQWDPSLL